MKLNFVTSLADCRERKRGRPVGVTSGGSFRRQDLQILAGRYANEICEQTKREEINGMRDA